MILRACWSETRIWKYSLFWFKFKKKDFSGFRAVLCDFGFKVGKKCWNDPLHLFSKNLDMRIKNAKFDATLNPLKNFYKISLKKGYQHESVGIRWFFIFSIVYKSSHPSNFLRVNYFATFSMDSSSGSNSVFFDTQYDIKSIWEKSIFWVILALLQTVKQRYIIIQFCIHQRVRTLNWLKNGPNCFILLCSYKPVHVCIGMPSFPNFFIDNLLWFETTAFWQWYTRKDINFSQKCCDFFLTNMKSTIMRRHCFFCLQFMSFNVNQLVPWQHVEKNQLFPHW